MERVLELAHGTERAGLALCVGGLDLVRTPLRAQVAHECRVVVQAGQPRAPRLRPQRAQLQVRPHRDDAPHARISRDLAWGDRISRDLAWGDRISRDLERVVPRLTHLPGSGFRVRLGFGPGLKLGIGLGLGFGPGPRTSQAGLVASARAGAAARAYRRTAGVCGVGLRGVSEGLR